MFDKKLMYVLQYWLKSVQKRAHLLIQLLIGSPKLFQECFPAWNQLRTQITISLTMAVWRRVELQCNMYAVHPC